MKQQGLPRKPYFVQIHRTYIMKICIPEQDRSGAGLVGACERRRMCKSTRAVVAIAAVGSPDPLFLPRPETGQPRLWFAPNSSRGRPHGRKNREMNSRRCTLRYMKHKFVFFGLKAAQRRQAAKGVMDSWSHRHTTRAGSLALEEVRARVAPR